MSLDAATGPDVRDVRAGHELARTWPERAWAVNAHFTGGRAEALESFRSSLRRVRAVPGILGSDGPYRLLVGRHTSRVRWSELIAALEEELEDYEAGRCREHYYVGSAEFCECGNSSRGDVGGR